ncbi:NAD(P)-binding protein [Hymenopellis radicata]|nr:NAD(P)-binding protein [Hymenopellis radicata]
MSDKSSKLLFITGGTGFIGFHILSQLLEAGYPVRAAARGRKVLQLRTALAKYAENGKLQVVDIPDLFTPSLSNALQGVYGIVHVASLMRPKDVDSAFQFAIDGSLFILEEAIKAGVAKFVGTSSTVTYEMTGPFGPDDFNAISKEDAIADSSNLYHALKIAADKAIMDFSDAHPELDVTLIGPDLTYGPFAPGFEKFTVSDSGPIYETLSTNGFIYRLLQPTNDKWFPHAWGANDVRDTARAHVLALDSPPASQVGHKRFPIVTPDNCSYRLAVEIIAMERPLLKDRLATDRKRIEEVIGLQATSYTPWKQTILDTVDSLVALENYWTAKGFKISLPDVHPLA